jgi:Na+/H+-translocating membrane pyrophosphatase
MVKIPRWMMELESPERRTFLGCVSLNATNLIEPLKWSWRSVVVVILRSWIGKLGRTSIVGIWETPIYSTSRRGIRGMPVRVDAK